MSLLQSYQGLGGENTNYHTRMRAQLGYLSRLLSPIRHIVTVGFIRLSGNKEMDHYHAWICEKGHTHTNLKLGPMFQVVSATPLALTLFMKYHLKELSGSDIPT